VEITVGAIGSVECMATAVDSHSALVRREGETLNALLRRLHGGIARSRETRESTDEISVLST